MKRCGLILLSALLIVIAFAGCGENKNEEIAGKWTVSTARINGETVQYNELDIADGQFELYFESDGKCRTTLAGITSEGSYTFSGTSVDIDINGEIQKLDYENGTLTLVLDYGSDSASFTFTKAR